MDTGDLVLRNSENAERIIVAQVEFGGEREQAEIAQRLEVVRMHAGVVELAAIGGDIVVGMPERPFQPLRLQRGDLVARCRLDGFEAIGPV